MEVWVLSVMVALGVGGLAEVDERRHPARLIHLSPLTRLACSPPTLPAPVPAAELHSLGLVLRLKKLLMEFSARFSGTHGIFRLTGLVFVYYTGFLL